jgi:hypothetical protein
MNLETLYLQARAGNPRARAVMNDIKTKMRAGDVQANRAFDALSVIHWRSRSASEWMTVQRLYDRMARQEPEVWKWADDVRKRAHEGHEQAIRMYAMLRAIHMQRTTKTPETAGYNMRTRQIGFVVGNSADDWALLLSMIQAALAEPPNYNGDIPIAMSEPLPTGPALLGPTALATPKASLVSSALKAVSTATKPATAPTLGKRKLPTTTRTPECQAYMDLSIKLGTTNPNTIQNHPMLIPIKQALQNAMDACARSNAAKAGDPCTAYENAKRAGQKQVILDALQAKCRASRGY